MHIPFAVTISLWKLILLTILICVPRISLFTNMRYNYLKDKTSVLMKRN